MLQRSCDVQTEPALVNGTAVAVLNVLNVAI